MKNPWAILPSIILVAVSMAGAPSASAEAGSDDTIVKGDLRSAAAMLAGRFVRMAGEVPDFMGAGQTVTITGDVEDNAVAFGQAVQLDGGRIGGDLVAMGQTVLIDGEIDGDVYAGCGEFRVTPRGVIRGNLYLGSDKLSIEGRVAGQLRGRSERIILEGELGGGDISLGERGRLELGPTATVSGDLRYSATEPVEVPEGARILGALDFEEFSEADSGGGHGFSLLKFLWSLVAAMIVGLALLSLAGPWMRSSAASLSGGAGRAFGWGALFLIATPLAVILLAVSMVGIPLGILAAAAYATALYLASLPLSLWLGDWLLRKSRLAAPGAFFALSLGLLVYKVLAALPWLGIPVVLATWILGLGAMFMGCRGAVRSA